MGRVSRFGLRSSAIPETGAEDGVCLVQVTQFGLLPPMVIAGENEGDKLSQPLEFGLKWNQRMNTRPLVLWEPNSGGEAC